MKYCTNCGQELTGNAKFCANCGTAANNNSSTKRKTVYDGEIHKCPSCGEILTSFLANCPACGFELNNKNINSSLKQFISKIDELDKAIANEPSMPAWGWKTWGTTKRIFWVVLNILFFCVPLIIYFYAKMISILLPNARYNKTLILSPLEKQKVALIENFTFPNERESIIELLLFVKSKVSFLISGEIDKKSSYWIALWTSKAEQLFLKAQMLSINDKTINEIYHEIKTQKDSIKNQLKIKAILYTALILVLIVFSFIKNADMYNTNQIDEDSTSSEDSTEEVADDSQSNLVSNNEDLGEFNNLVNGNYSSVIEERFGDFIIGYEKAEFDRYNSPASENGLGDSRIYFYCTLEETEILEADGTTSILGYVADENENKWLVHLHVYPIVSKTAFDSYIGEKVILRGVYSGFSGTKEMPAVVLDEMIVLSTGESVIGMQKLLDE